MDSTPQPEIEVRSAESISAPAVETAHKTSLLLLELTLVYVALWLPLLFNATSRWIWFTDHNADDGSFGYQMAAWLVGSVQALAIIFLVIWRAECPLRHFGIVRLEILKDMALAILLVVAIFMIWTAYWMVMLPLNTAIQQGQVSTEDLFAKPQSLGGALVVVVGCCANGFAEELATRGYLIPRCRQLFGSPARAVVISSVVFASYHIYQQPLEVLCIFIFGLLYGSLFVVIGRLWPFAIAHAVVDMLFYFGT